MTNKKENQLIFELYASDMGHPFTRVWVIAPPGGDNQAAFYMSALEQGMRQFDIMPRLAKKGSSYEEGAQYIDFAAANQGAHSEEFLKDLHDAVTDLVNQVLDSVYAEIKLVDESEPDPDDEFEYQTRFVFRSNAGREFTILVET